MKQLIKCLVLVPFLSCQNKEIKDETTSKTPLPESVVDMTINREGEFFVVIKITVDSVNASGNKYETVELKNSRNQHYWSSGWDNKLKVGDRAMIGHNAAGEYMITDNPDKK